MWLQMLQFWLHCRSILYSIYPCYTTDATWVIIEFDAIWKLTTSYINLCPDLVSLLAHCGWQSMWFIWNDMTASGYRFVYFVCDLHSKSSYLPLSTFLCVSYLWSRTQILHSSIKWIRSISPQKFSISTGSHIPCSFNAFIRKLFYTNSKIWIYCRKIRLPFCLIELYVTLSIIPRIRRTICNISNETVVGNVVELNKWIISKLGFV